MSHSDLTADEAAALRLSVQASIARLGDAEAVADGIGALDLFEEALPALAIFFEEFGRHHLVSALTDALVGRVLGIGDTALAFALPRRGFIAPPAATRGDAGDLRIDAVLRAPAALPSRATVPLEDGATVVPLSELHITAASGFDADGTWLRVQGELPEDEVTAIGAADWAPAVAIARLSLGSEMLGVATQINSIAIEHVTTRQQFGKPLGSFQTVRHRLAEAHVAIQAAQTLLGLGWADAADADRSGNVGVYAIAAKAAAGRAFEAASRTANQVCGGMGLTLEHPLPAFVRRGSALNVLLGDPTDLTAAIGYALCAAEPLPRPDPLIAQGEHVGAR